MFQSPGKERPWESDPTPLEIASSWTPFPLEFLMPSVGGSINHILVWRVTISIFSWTNAGIHVIAPGVTASFSLNFLNSLLLLNVQVFSADTKQERHFKITSVNWQWSNVNTALVYSLKVLTWIKWTHSLQFLMNLLLWYIKLPWWPIIYMKLVNEVQ